MLNSTPIHRGDELRQSQIWADILPPYRVHQKNFDRTPSPDTKQYRRKSMDSTSPVSPSTSSPTSSEASFSLPSPRAIPYRPFWSSKAASPLSSPKRPKSLIIQSPTPQKMTLQYILSSPLEQTVQDGDMLMLSPSGSICPAVWQETTTSPILGQLMGLPLRNLDDGDRKGSNSTAIRTVEPQPSLQISTASKSSRADCNETEPRAQARGRSTGRVSTSTQAHSRPRSYSRSRPKIQKTRQKIPKVYVPDSRKTYLQNSIVHLGTPLVPLISVVSGLAHPSFPRSILQYHLLTHDQLDHLARWYHQTIDNTQERFMYPAVIERPWTWSSEEVCAATKARAAEAGIILKEVELATKRRRFGRFIGLRGCETPVITTFENTDQERRETLDEQLEREWREALKKAEEEERLLEKVWRGRW